MKFTITIEETISDNFEVVAESKEQALDMAITKYKSCEFALQPGNLISKHIQIQDDSDNINDWIEF